MVGCLFSSNREWVPGGKTVDVKVARNGNGHPTITQNICRIISREREERRTYQPFWATCNPSVEELMKLVAPLPDNSLEINIGNV